MEKVASVLDKHCTFPAIEKLKLFRLMIFNFLVGNEDMHLKNFSLIRHENKVELSPAYDLLSTTIAMKTKEESALPIGGRKSRLTRRNFLDYGSERLGLTDAVLSSEFVRFKKALKKWEELIDSSFLSEKYRDRYKNLIDERWERLTND